MSSFEKSSEIAEKISQIPIKMVLSGIIENILFKDPQIPAKYSSNYQKSHILHFQTLPILQKKNSPLLSIGNHFK
jgi:hypothetical protein